MGDFGKCIRGVSYNGTMDLYSNDCEQSIKLLRSNNVQNSMLNLDDVQYVNRERVKAKQILQEDDILICMANGSKKLVGKSAFYEKRKFHSYTFGAFMGRYRKLTPNIVNSYFLFSIFQSEEYRKQVELLLAGSSINNLTPNSIESIEFYCPNDISEQNSIAEVLSDVDGLLGALEALIAKKWIIKHATMQQLLTGKTRLPGFCEEWVKNSLGNLATVTMGQSPPSVSYNIRGSGVPLLQGNADIKNRKSLERVWTTQPSKLCDSDDLLLTVRAPVGIVASAKNSACLGRGICGLKPTIDSSFLFYALVFAESRWQVDEQGSTFTAVNRKQVEQFRLRIPADENEQIAIATVLSDMDAEIAVLERRRDKTLAIKKGMMQQLLTGRIRLAKAK